MAAVNVPQAAAPPRLTPDAFARLPDSNTTELVNGRPVGKTSDARSSETEGRIAYRFATGMATARASEVFVVSLGYQVFRRATPGDPDRIRKPDVSVIRRERLVPLAERDPDFMPLVPDLAVEVVSKFDVWSDLVGRVHEYQAAGFPLVWIADPGFRTVMVHPLAGQPSLLSGVQTITAEAALPGFACKVSDLFPPSV